MTDTLAHKDFKEMSETELKQYIADGKKKIKEIKAETAKLKAQAAADKKKTEEMRAEIDRLKADSAVQLKKLGWDKFPEEVLTWLQTNYTKEWQYFKPSPESILKRYNERTSSTLKPAPIDPKFKGFEDMLAINAWIAPDGVFYPLYDWAQHEKWAADYLREHRKDLYQRYLSNDNHKYAHELLESVGWIRVMTWQNTDTLFSKDYGSRTTKRQADTLRLFCSLHNLPEPHFLA